LHEAQPGKTAEKRGSVIVRPESWDEHLGVGPQRGKIGLLPIADDSQTRHTGQGALPRLVRDQHRDRASGYFLTKSQRYSTTFRATEDPNHNPIDPETVTVINDWQLVHIGHNNHGERELALAIAERNGQHRRSTIDARRAA
jgi:hypothetical protein